VASGADFKQWKPGQLNNICAIQSLHRRDAALLDRILGIIAAAFAGQVLQYGATFLATLTRVLVSNDVDDARLIEVLAATSQAKWMVRFDSLAAQEGWSKWSAAPEVLRRVLAGTWGGASLPTVVAAPAAPSAPPPESRRALTHDERMAKVAAGCGIVVVQPIRKADPDRTLGGVGSAMC
jgi:hypothetical protein